MKFKVGDKVVIADGQEWFDKKEYKTITGREVAYNLDNSSIAYNEKMLKLYKGEEKMEKTFREVIRDIKIGEFWEDKVFLIYLENDYLQIDFKGGEESTLGIEIKLDDIFTLRKEKVDLITALKSYDEGRIIVSCITGSEFRKSKDRDAIIYELKGESYEYTERNDAPIFSFEEIKGGWYVNE